MLLNLARSGDQAQIRFTRLFREYGLTPSQYNVLRILRGEGNPLPSLEIAGRTITVVPGITGLVDRLEQAGMATRVRCEEDRRVVYVSITPKALKVLEQLDKPVQALHQQLAGHLSKAELKELNRMLERLRAPWSAEPS